MLSLVLEGLVAVLLVATIAYCYVLNRRLGLLKNLHAELHTVIGGFDEAVEKAQHGLDDLKQAGNDIGLTLQDQIDKARALADELSLMTDAGERVADRLDKSVDARRGSVPELVPALENDDQPLSGETLPSRTERELMTVLRRVK